MDIINKISNYNSSLYGTIATILIFILLILVIFVLGLFIGIELGINMCNCS